MRKLFLGLIIAANFAACTSSPSSDSDQKIASTIFVEQKVNEFIKANPDWAKDETIQKATTDKFKHAVINWSNEPNFLQDMPFQLKGLRDTLLNETNFKIATFVGYNDNTRVSGSILNYIQLQIDGIVPPDLEKDLTLSKNYTITGNLYKQGKRGDVKYISVADFKGYDLGKYLFSVTAVKPIK
jgi:hypothetical protein